MLVSAGQDLFVGAAFRDQSFPPGNTEGLKVSPVMMFLEVCAPRRFAMSFACLLAEVF